MSGKRKKPEPPRFEAVNRRTYDYHGTLCCGACDKPVTITITGLLCDCPRVMPHQATFSEDKKRYPKQFQTSDLDKDTAEMTGATP